MVRQKSLTFENTEQAPVQARRFVERCLNAWGLRGIGERVALGVSELTTNAVVHGRGRINPGRRRQRRSAARSRSSPRAMPSEVIWNSRTVDVCDAPRVLRTVSARFNA
mgnify:CR=1 FL=1